MSQVSQITIDNQAFSTFRTALNNSFGALNTGHIGSSRPGSAAAGTIWLDNSVTNTITSKTVSGFVIEFFNSSGSTVDRTFDFIAEGVGQVIT